MGRSRHSHAWRSFSLSCGHKESGGYQDSDEIEAQELFVSDKVTAGGILLLIQNKELAFLCWKQACELRRRQAAWVALCRAICSPLPPDSSRPSSLHVVQSLPGKAGRRPWCASSTKAGWFLQLQLQSLPDVMLGVWQGGKTKSNVCGNWDLDNGGHPNFGVI